MLPGFLPPWLLFITHDILLVLHVCKQTFDIHRVRISDKVNYFHVKTKLSGDLRSALDFQISHRDL